jgi:predicted nucleotide-binding protein
MLRVTSSGRPRRRIYRRLADRFANIGDTFGADPFELLEESLGSSWATRVVGFSIVGSATDGDAMQQLRCFLVHGHDSRLLLELKDFVQNAMGWPEPVILAQQPNRGRTIIEKFEEYADSVDVVCVLMTPDDAGDEPDLMRARQNVIFELGYFVRHFGRKSGRVLLLVAGHVDVPSDLAGVLYIDVSNGIESAGERIRREVADLDRRDA